MPTIGSPTPAPTATALGTASAPTALAISIPALSATFRSPLHGYTVLYPAGWTVTPASTPWVGDAGLLWGDPALDDLHGSNVRLVVASQELKSGQTGADWIAARSGAPACEGVSTMRAQVPVGSALGTVTLNGCTAAKEGIASGGVIYDVIVVVGQRGYDFTVDGIVDAAYAQALLASVTFAP